MLRTRFRHLVMIGVTLGSLACSAGAADKPEKAPSFDGPVQNRVEMTVTEHGFEPQNVRVKSGEPVTLVITRKTDSTCATEIVIDEYGVNTKLPLNTAVTLSFTPKKSGMLKYGCAMQKMIGGVIKVE
ncbi:MAG: cupredoxin domain-containing protein [Myxococcales bacterium]